jgi:myo-inositol-1(or 4)-monophosphatase
MNEEFTKAEIVDFQKLHTGVALVLKQAENVLLQSFGQVHEISVKKGVSSQAALVTEVDQKVDDLFRNKLAKLFPEYGFITEEGKQTGLREYNWIIDPLDGTTNYLHGFPLFGISIALWHRNEPLYGCISLPKFGQRLYGWKNGGAWLNGEQLHPKIPVAPKPMVLIAPVADPSDHGKIIETIGELLAAPRDFGCCVYQGFETITGKADVDIMYKLSLWDIGAIVLLAKEASLVVEYVSAKPDLQTEDPKAYAHTVIIGNQQFKEKIQQLPGLLELL